MGDFVLAGTEVYVHSFQMLLRGVLRSVRLPARTDLSGPGFLGFAVTPKR